jgi:hypothetical protein
MVVRVFGSSHDLVSAHGTISPGRFALRWGRYVLYNGTSTWQALTSTADLATEFDTPKSAGADGVIVWGSSMDADSPARCGEMAQYFASKLGPKLGSLAGPPRFLNST